MSLAALDGQELMHHVMVELLWKAGIVAALIAIGILAAVVIWKRL